MGRVDESLLSTASTLVDSCTMSMDLSLDSFYDGGAAAKENYYGLTVKPTIVGKQRNSNIGHRGTWLVAANSRSNTAESVEMRNDKIVYPTAATHTNNRFLSPGDYSVEASTTTAGTTNSKLDILRARTKMLRKQGSQKIAESRVSLRKNRTVSIDFSPRPNFLPVVEKPEDVLAAAAPRRNRTNASTLMRGKIMAASREMDLPVLLRRSNNVIHQLTTEMATAGDIISQSSHHHRAETIVILDNSSSINDGSSYAYLSPTVEPSDHESIEDDNSSLGNISVGEDWDQSTISASAAGDSSHFEPLSPSIGNMTPPPPQSINCSGLPPPEVVVKITPPRAPSPRAVAEARHRRQRPPSISPRRGDCASMYNTNQKCEKISIENDCLRRQLDLLESRHRDFQCKLEKQLMHDREEVPEAMRTPGSPTTYTSSTMSRAKSYRKDRIRRKKKSDRRRLAVVLMVTPFLFFSSLWFYRAVRNASLARRMNRAGSLNGGLGSTPFFFDTNHATLAKPALNGLASLMREGVLRQTPLGPILFRDKRNVRIKIEDKKVTDDDNDATNSKSNEEEILDYTDNLPVLALPKYRRIHGTAGRDDFNSTSSGRKGNRLKRWFQKRLSKIKITKEHDSSGVWLKKSRQIKTRKLHEEL